MKLLSFSQINGGKALLKKVDKIEEKLFQVYTENIIVEESKQKEFTLQLTDITEDLIFKNYPMRILINGISYHQPDFDIDFETKKLTWNRIDTNEGFDIDLDDDIIIEIPIKTKNE